MTVSFRRFQCCASNSEATKDGALLLEQNIKLDSCDCSSTASSSSSSSQDNDSKNTPVVAPLKEPHRGLLSRIWNKIAPQSTTVEYVKPLTVPGGTMLHGCSTAQEHFDLIKLQLATIQDLHGDCGLHAINLEYRFIPCSEHAFGICKSTITTCNYDYNDDDFDDAASGGIFLGSVAPSLPSHPNDSASNDAAETMSLQSNVSSSHDDEPLQDIIHWSREASIATRSLKYSHSYHQQLDALEHKLQSFDSCYLCARRLFHTLTNTMITESNRTRFIADGLMFDQVARLCQEYAHEICSAEENMQWMTVEEYDDDVKEPIRILVNADHPILFPCANNTQQQHGPTLVVATGRGKVRAGMFSRNHLFCSGIESSSALPFIRDARLRGMNVILIDPNVHGERYGYEVFTKSMQYIMDRWHSSDNTTTPVDNNNINIVKQIYILSHSASGGQLARYLIDNNNNNNCQLLRYIRAVAFTDSTHNIQWAYKANCQAVADMLQSDICVYFKGANPHRDGNRWYLHAAGEPCTESDQFWQHRFGTIGTYWAGTKEHSMTNWYALRHIWQHFDRILGYDRQRHVYKDAEMQSVIGRV